MGYFRIRTLTPVHIGMGDDFVPTQYVIDGGKLYLFDEFTFYRSLSETERKAFANIAGEGIYALKRFYRNRLDLAREIAYQVLPVDGEISKRYETQFNRDGSLNNNRLEIQRTATIEGASLPYLPGSSLKGVIDTSLAIYPQEIRDNAVRQNLQVSDFVSAEAQTWCGKAYRIHKFKDKPGKGIPIMVEAIEPSSIFVGEIGSVKKGESDRIFSMEEILEALDTYAKHSGGHEYRKYRSELEAGEYLFRMGRFSGIDFTCVSRCKPAVTHTVIDDHGKKGQPFGWVAISMIDAETYWTHLRRYEEKLEERLAKRSAIVQRLESAEKKRKEEEHRKIEQQQEEERKKAEEEARIAAMSPFDRKLHELVTTHPNKNETVDIILFSTLKRGELDEFRCQALRRIKKEMQEHGKWIEKSKKPEKDKKYKRTMEMIKMLEECEG
ncbi:RAMP superfamily CRISPR-associated protein [Nitratifractor sp.]